MVLALCNVQVLQCPGPPNVPIFCCCFAITCLPQLPHYRPATLYPLASCTQSNTSHPNPSDGAVTMPQINPYIAASRNGIRSHPARTGIIFSRQKTPNSVAGFFLLEIVDAKSMSGALHQNLVVPLLQDVFVRISASAVSRATCATSLSAGLLSKISLSGSLRQDPVVGPLVQDHRVTISCARCLCRDVCIRSL